MRAKANGKLVFLDLETTGLDPQKDNILEVGVLIVDSSSLDRDTEKQGDWLVRPPWMFPAAARHFCSSFVLEMHKNSGLLDLLNSYGAPNNPEALLPTPREVEKFVCNFLLEHGIEYGTATLAGNSVHFDKSFLDAKMPVLAGWFHHQIVDVSSIRVLLNRWTGSDLSKYMDKRFGTGFPRHRALNDCHWACEELRMYRRYLMQGAQELAQDAKISDGSTSAD